ncbi:MAG: histidine kinase [Bacteroidales bacterium]|nr:histidine kinase [Bacteroidales bacterium]
MNHEGIGDMMSYLKNRWIRWGSILLLGMILRFSLDVIFSLMYRNYPLFQSVTTYLFTLLITFFSLELFYRVKQQLDKRFPWEADPYKRFFRQWIYGIGLALFFAMVLRWVYLLTFNRLTFIALSDELIRIGFIVVIITIVTVVELSVFLLEKWRFSLAELERFKKENAEFQFESLRSQVNPHFLFNSLNTLASLIYSDKEKAEIFIRELSDVYRYVLDNRGKEIVAFSRELQVARSYLFLLGLRFEKNMMVEWNIQPEMEKMMIAPLTLQLLIENAVKHNVISKKKPLTIHITAENGKLIVKNNLQKKEIKEYSSQLGLKNIKSRYAFLTSGEVDITETSDEFIVKVPLIEAQ